jgi:hypoxanthine phosphoribosyltransferase
LAIADFGDICHNLQSPIFNLQSETTMAVVTVHDKSFETYLSEETIQQRIKEVAADINRDYAGKRPFFIAILNGSFMFASDLFKQLTVDADICFIKLASYKGMQSSGKVLTTIGLDDDLFGKDVIIVEDIVDTGKTLHNFLPRLEHQQPNSLKIATLLHKPEATAFELKLDYIGFTIPNKFVVGYGLDYDGLGRNYKEIYQLM